jgi:hypothetical protein
VPRREGPVKDTKCKIYEVYEGFTTGDPDVRMRLKVNPGTEVLQLGVDLG